MAARKRTRKNISQIVGLLVAVIVVVTASVAFQHWWNSRPTDPHDTRVTFSWDGGKQTLEPYWVCDFGGDCPAGQAPVTDLGGSKTVTVEVPREISSNRWSLLTIYDNPAANDEKLFRPGEKTTLEVPVTAEVKADEATTARLLVVEVHAAMVGTDDQGEETPYSVVWAIHTTDGGAPTGDRDESPDDSQKSTQNGG